MTFDVARVLRTAARGEQRALSFVYSPFTHRGSHIKDLRSRLGQAGMESLYAKLRSGGLLFWDVNLTPVIVSEASYSFQAALYRSSAHPESLQAHVSQVPPAHVPPLRFEILHYFQTLTLHI